MAHFHSRFQDRVRRCNDPCACSRSTSFPRIFGRRRFARELAHPRASSVCLRHEERATRQCILRRSRQSRQQSFCFVDILLSMFPVSGFEWS